MSPPPGRNRRPAEDTDAGGGVPRRTGASIAPASADAKESNVIHLDNYRYWSHLPRPSRCEHGKPRERVCIACVRHRRRVTAIADRVIGKPEPEIIPPSTFGLAGDELCCELERLVKAGWSPGEVARVVAARRST